MTTVPPLVRVIRVDPREGFVLHVWFDDDSEKEIDVEWLLRGPIFEPIRSDLDLFRQVRVEGGTVAWPDGADIDPVVLHGSAVPAWSERGGSETPAG